MKHTVRRALAVLIAVLLALPTFALAEAPGGVEAPIEERLTYLGDDDGLTVVEEPAPAELPDADDDGEIIDDDTVESVDEVDGMLTAAGFVAQSDIPEGAFAVDFVCEPEDAAITVYPADGDEPIPAETGNLWYLAPGDYTYVAQAGDVTAQDSFTVADEDVTLWVSLAAEEAETLDENGEALMSVSGTSYLYYDKPADAIAGITTEGNADAIPVNENDYEWDVSNGGWYVVDEDVTIDDRIVVSGDVHLILCDGAELKALSGITVSDNNNSLTIYGQTGGTGALTISSVGDNKAGIGGDNGGNGAITIHGGVITVKGGKGGAGIGGGEGGVGNNITINGGTVYATGGEESGWCGAGIGGGDWAQNGGTITINGGTVVATGGANSTSPGAGIGGGYKTVGGIININGGSVTATGGGAAAQGIGRGSGGTSNGTLNLGDGVTLEISADGTDWSVYTGTRARYMQATYSAPATYTVTLNGGGNATTSGGETTQTVSGAMTNVVYTPNTGYHFVEGDFADVSQNGVTATYDSAAGTVTVSGTPTADVALTIPGAVEDAAVTTVEASYLYYSSVADAIAGTASSDTIEATIVTSSDAGWSDGWYVVNTDVINNNRIVVSGNVHLILADNKRLTASAGITVSGDNNSLTIYGQSGGTGALTISSVGGGAAGIGGGNEQNGGNITINGGDISVTGNAYGGAGIGGGNGRAGGNITINGGTVNATGGGGSNSNYAGAGIGGGDSADGGKITINGGTVNATGGGGYGYAGAGIGGGSYGNGGTIIINGGSVTATGGSADAKGIGSGDGYNRDDGTLTLGDGVTLQTSGDGTTWSEYTDTRAQYMRTTPVTYTVTLNGGGNATTSGGDTTQTVSGAMTTVTYTPSERYCFEAFDAIADHGITVSYDATTGNVIVSGTPTADVAIVIPGAVPCYAVTFDTSGGSVSATVNGSPVTAAAQGVDVTLSVTANDGYVLESLIVDGTNVTNQVSDGSYSFDMPDHDVTVSATFKQIVGKIGTTDEYTSFEALAAAIEGLAYDIANNVLYFTDDVTLVNYIRLLAEVTVDLNGHTVQVNNTTDRCISIGSSAQTASVTIQDSGTDGKLTITKGEEHAFTLYVWTGSSVEITGGEYSGSLDCDIANYGGTVTITGGTFRKGGFYTFGNENSVVSISGGLFATAPADSYLATGKKASWNETLQMFEIVDGVSVKIFDGATEKGAYETLAEALGQVTSGQTIVLPEGTFDLPNTAVIPANVTIQGQGKDNSGNYKTIVYISNEREGGFDGLKITNENVTFKDMKVYSGIDSTAGYSMINVKAAGAVIDNCLLDGGGMGGTCATLRLESIASSGTFTVRNSTVTGAYRGIYRVSGSADITVENTYIENVYAINLSEGGGSLSVSGGNLKGWTSYASGLTKAEFTGVTFGEGYAGQNTVQAYMATTFTNCVFNGTEVHGPKASSAFNWTFTNCKFGDVALTEANATELLGSIWEGTVVIDNKRAEGGLIRVYDASGNFVIGYDTSRIATALSASTSANGTVKLFADVTRSSTDSSVYLQISQPLTLDLNGHNITIDGRTYTNSSGTVKYNNVYGVVIATALNVRITDSCDNQHGTISNTTEIEGKNTSAIYTQHDDAVVTIENITASGKQYGTWAAQGTINISSGTILGGTQSVAKGSTATVSITGGTFSSQPAAAMIHEGYAAFSNGETPERWDVLPAATVTFDADGGTPAPANQTVIEGGKAAKPDTDPTKEGYRFVGWYQVTGTNPETLADNAFDFDNTAINADISLKAKWAQLFTVTIDADGGTPAPANQTVIEGGKAAKPDTDPTKDNFKFLGWFADDATEAFDFENTPIDGDITLTAHWAEAVTLTATLAADSGTPTGTITGTGDYYTGDSVTLTAPRVSGYNFTGWFAEGGAQNLCADRVYTFTVGATTAFVAKYTALPTALITIKGGGHKFLVNGVEQSDTYQWSCQIGTTVTIQSQEDSFAYWMNSYGMQLTTKKTYSFTVTSAETITAEYNTIIDGKAKVIFESYYGQVIAQKQFADGDDEALPALPTRKGYTTLGWDCDGDGMYDASKDTLSAAISRGLASTNTSKTVTVLAVYQLMDQTYSIKVVNGTGGGSYMEDTKITVEADAPASGQKFSHWKDSEGTILGYETTYTFYAVKDMTLTAVYVNDTASVEAVGTTVIEAITKDTTNNKLIFVTMSTVPEGCVIQKAGIIATNVEEVGTSGDGFNDTTAAFVRAGTPKGRTLEYTWTKSKVNTDDVWYARAYLVYTNVNGNSCTIYGPMVSITY